MKSFFTLLFVGLIRIVFVLARIAVVMIALFSLVAACALGMVGLLCVAAVYDFVQTFFVMPRDLFLRRKTKTPKTP